MKYFRSYLNGAVDIFITDEGRYRIVVDKSYLELPRGIRLNFNHRTGLENMTFAYTGVSKHFITSYMISTNLLHKVVDWLLRIVDEDRLFDSKVSPVIAFRPPSVVRGNPCGYLVRVHPNGKYGCTAYWIDPVTGKRTKIPFSNTKGPSKKLVDDLLKAYLELEWEDEDILDRFKPTEEYVHHIRNVHVGPYVEEVIHLLGA